MSYKNLDIESKMAKVIYTLRRIRPFYSAVYESMKREETTQVETMGVTTNKVVYNKKFVEGLEFEELMFVDLHEIVHVALMHVSRRKNRDPELWNIAADLYVNKLLSEEFSILPGETNTGELITFPKSALFCSSLDLNNDYVEQIYEELNKQAQENGYSAAKNKVHNIEDTTDTFHFSYKGSLDKSESRRSGNDTFELDVSLDYSGDIMPSSADSVTQENENRQVLSEAQVRSQMTGGAGNKPGLLEFHVSEILKSHVDWRKLLRKYCIKATSSDSTFSNPDKRMYYQRAIYPGQAQDESLLLRGVKVCFDASGSISDKDIAYFYGQVRDILKEFKVQAELIYWDTEIESSGDFKSFHEMQNISSIGRGGTDPSCIFEYFDTHKCKVKPIVTLIFTDGFFYGDFNKAKFKRKYKDTIWVMTRDYNRDFKPSFGQVTVARFSE